MNLQKCKLALAVAATLAAGGATAAITAPSAVGSQGNSSVVFMAMDLNNNIALTLDLGLVMSDFTNSTSLTSGLTGPITWDFSANTTTASGVTGSIAWSAAYESFKSLQSGGDFVWGIVAGDQVTGAAGPTNPIAGRGLLATGNATPAEMLAASTSGPTGTALGNMLNFFAASNNFGTHLTADNGANTATPSDGSAWTNDLMKSNFNGSLTWSYWLANGESSTFQWQQQLVANPVVNQFGNPTAVDSLSAAPVTFTFDIATNQLILAPVPEPGSVAMLLAGLGAVGFMARRRKA
jgi:hypothetical protein